MIFKKTIKLFAVALFVLAVSAVGAYFYVKAEIYKPLDSFGIYKSFKVSRGESLDQISKNLADEGLIKNSFYFKIYAWGKRIAQSIKAGDYNLSSEMNIPQIASIITAGRVADREITVLIPEGLTIAETENILVDRKLLAKGELSAAADGGKIKKYYSLYSLDCLALMKLIEKNNNNRQMKKSIV